MFNVGLCIALFDLISVGDEYIFPSDGGSHIQVEFRLMVFRPFVGEVLTGKIRSCNQHGIMGSFISLFSCLACSFAVSLEFFEDVIIPLEHLKSGTGFNTREQVWIWHFDGNEARLDNHQVPTAWDSPYLRQEIRFRVVENIFMDITPHSGM